MSLIEKLNQISEERREKKMEEYRAILRSGATDGKTAAKLAEVCRELGLTPADVASDLATLEEHARLTAEEVAAGVDPTPELQTELKQKLEELQRRDYEIGSYAIERNKRLAEMNGLQARIASAEHGKKKRAEAMARCLARGGRVLPQSQ